jgi:hypothetical protein
VSILLCIAPDASSAAPPSTQTPRSCFSPLGGPPPHPLVHPTAQPVGHRGGLVFWQFPLRVLGARFNFSWGGAAQRVGEVRPGGVWNPEPARRLRVASSAAPQTRSGQNAIRLTAFDVERTWQTASSDASMGGKCAYTGRLGKALSQYSKRCVKTR